MNHSKQNLLLFSLFKKMRQVLLVVFVLMVGLGFVSCGGAGGDIPGGDNPLAPPAPPIQLPAFATFPEDLGIDLSALDTSGASAATQSLFLGVGDSFTLFIDTVFEAATIALDNVNTITENLNAANIPVSPLINNFEYETEIDRIDGPITIKTKIDFSPYDYDGDGVVEDCSGTSCPVVGGVSCPTEAQLDEIKSVCLRVWVERSDGIFVRDKALVIDLYASETNVGRGRIRAGDFEEDLVFDNGAAQTKGNIVDVEYDHFDVANPLNQRSLIGLSQFFNYTEQPELQSVGTSQLYLEQSADNGATVAAETVKTVKIYREGFENINSSGEEIDPRQAFFQSISKFVDDERLMVASSESDENGVKLDVFNFDNQCIELELFFGVELNLCDQVGLSLTGEAFLEKPADDVFLFPVDFPEVPTF